MRSLFMWCFCFSRKSRPAQGLARTLLSLTLLLSLGCNRVGRERRATISFDHVPPATGGAPGRMEHIEGRVLDAPNGAFIVLYAWNEGVWWVQPFRSRSSTQVRPGGFWSTSSHIGARYAALLVQQGFRPQAQLPALPALGGPILASAVMAGTGGSPFSKTLRFSGYDWSVRNAAHNQAGEVCDYDPENAWIDERGRLHLRMGLSGEQWRCSGVSLTRSLGYGTYRFTLLDASAKPPSVVFAMFTQAEREDPSDRAEMDIELSQWGKSHNLTGAFVVQPYYVPENNLHFTAPTGRATYMLRWEPGWAEFSATEGLLKRGIRVPHHVFKSGVPVPATETVHMVLYDFHHSQSGLQHPVEVTVEKFEYLP
jgi:hypothetical protein